MFKEDDANQALGCRELLLSFETWCIGRLCRQAQLQEEKEGAAATLINCATYKFDHALSSLSNLLQIKGVHVARLQTCNDWWNGVSDVTFSFSCSGA